ncbi:tyrosine-type recombinase/integrase [Ornithinibacillus contaminans]|uniref:tyrosine-type recombinase/integrase n=1 Tax=Ornithinibacillus contaminans TaxID=694055 RepID=UPI00064DD497|nr:tyrosine-type recombinase/integrase [Ornithinibacillus contaminans]
MVINKDTPIVDDNPSSLEIEWRCGNSKFNDDIWDFKGFVYAPHWNDAKFRIDFTVFNDWPNIKVTVKRYIMSELKMVVYNSVKRKYAAFSQLRKFLKNKQHIQSFQDFTNNIVREYFEYLINVDSVRGAPLSAQSITKSAQCVKDLLIRGSQRGWQVPRDSARINNIYDELIIRNNRVIEGTKLGKTNKVLPDSEIVDKLINLAREKIRKGEDVLVSAGILISTQLGHRISEVVLMEANRLSTINGEAHITFLTWKTKKELVWVTRPANEILVETIKALEKYSEPLRIKTGKPYLFIVKARNQKDRYLIADHSNWGKNRLTPFIKKHGLRDEHGKPLKLTQHYFRHIFTTYALKGGMKIQDVAEMLGHASILMTETYDHTKHEKQEVIKGLLSGEIPISSSNKTVIQRIEGEENPFKGKTVEQIDKMRRSLKIELLPHGMCLHHPMRGEPCAQDGVCLGCNNFIASSNHLPIYEKRLERVDKELEKNDENSIFSSKLRYQREKLSSYISDLERKMAESEFQDALEQVAGAKYEK